MRLVLPSIRGSGSSLIVSLAAADGRRRRFRSGTRARRLNGEADPRGKYRLTVDGVRVSSDPQPLPSVGPIRLVVYWPSVARRQVLVELDHVPWGGVRIESSGLVEPVSAPSQRVIVLGDSVTAGTGALASFTGFVQSAAAILGWTDAWASGVGGTGYVNPGPPGQVAFINRVDHDVISYAPSVVLVAGGTNDHAYAPTDVQAAAAALYQRIADGLPAATVYVMGPWCAKGPAPAHGWRPGTHSYPPCLVSQAFVSSTTSRSNGSPEPERGASEGGWKRRPLYLCRRYAPHAGWARLRWATPCSRHPGNAMRQTSAKLR